MQDVLSRRRFLVSGTTGLSTAWVAANWPAALAAGQHAHHSVQSGVPQQFEFFTPEQATEIDALTSCIIPSDDTPGAREAGVVYFIDRALKTFASSDRQLYADGIAELQAVTRAMFPGVEKFSATNPNEQLQILHALDKNRVSIYRPFRPRPQAQNFFETLRQHAILGFLIDPSSDLRGNRGGVGWQTINREPDHTFQPPFGYYDKDYPGWQAATETDKK